MNYRAGANPRDTLEPNVYEVGAPLQAWLHYHHEMAYVAKSTTLVSFLCKRELPGRGATFVSDNLRATEALLETEFGRKLRRPRGVLPPRSHRPRGVRRPRAGRRLQPLAAVARHRRSRSRPNLAPQASGLVTSWGADRKLQTRYYTSAFEYFPQLDRNVLYSEHRRPRHLVRHVAARRSGAADASARCGMTFGDDTDFTRRATCAPIVDVYDRFGTPLDWRVGDVAVICNYRFAHGRPSIVLGQDEERELGVLLGSTFDRVGDRPRPLVTPPRRCRQRRRPRLSR